MLKRRLPYLNISLWHVAAWTAAIFVLVPIISLASKGISADGNIWPHLSRTMLPLYMRQTFTLMFGVGLLSTVIGVSSAYCIARFDFFGKSVLAWALILPMAVPTYLVAYVYTDLLEYAGPVQRWIREFGGFSSAKDYPFFRIRSMGGCIVTLSLVLYPYVYLLARASFLEQSQSIHDSSRILGVGKITTFVKVTLPLARPAIIVGVMLVLMEVLNDFGAVDHFAIQTFSAGIYDYWLGRNNIEGAAQISLLMLSFIIVLVAAEQLSRRKQALFQKANSNNTCAKAISPAASIAVICICSLPVLLGFIVPSARLLFFVIYHNIEQSPHIVTMIGNSLGLSFTAASLTCLLALIVAYSRRTINTPLVHCLGITSGFGYAIPGAVLAIGVLVPFGLMDRSINNIAEHLTGERVGLIFSGTVAIIIIAYIIRFMSIAQGTIYAGLQKITPSIDQSAQLLGCSHRNIITRVHFPLLKKSILTAMLIVFVDSMKELPATLILRPFNFDTLATHIYQFASDELLEETSLAALMIIAVGLIPVIWLNYNISKKTADE